MSKINYESFTADELEEIAKEAKVKAKIKKKEETEKIHLALGKYVFKNIDNIINSNLELNLRKEIAKLSNKEITKENTEIVDKKKEILETKITSDDDI